VCSAPPATIHAGDRRPRHHSRSQPSHEANHFTQRRLERFDAAHGWPDRVSIFTITLNELAAVEGHLLRYYATLISAN
jgi:hypothetical protein